MCLPPCFASLFAGRWTSRGSVPAAHPSFCRAGAEHRGTVRGCVGRVLSAVNCATPRRAAPSGWGTLRCELGSKCAALEVRSCEEQREKSGSAAARGTSRELVHLPTGFADKRSRRFRVGAFSVCSPDCPEHAPYVRRGWCVSVCGSGTRGVWLVPRRGFIKCCSPCAGRRGFGDVRVWRTCAELVGDAAGLGFLVGFAATCLKLLCSRARSPVRGREAGRPAVRVKLCVQAYCIHQARRPHARTRRAQRGALR